MFWHYLKLWYYCKILHNVNYFFFFYNSKPSQPSIKIPLLSCPIKTSQYVFKPSTHSAFCSLRDMYTNQGTQPAPMTTTIEWGILAGEICYSVISHHFLNITACEYIYIYFWILHVNNYLVIVFIIILCNAEMLLR